MEQTMARPGERTRAQNSFQPSASTDPRVEQPLITQPSAYQPRRDSRAAYRKAGYGRDFLSGLVGGAVGVLAMDLFRHYVSPLIMPDDNGLGANGNTQGGQAGRERHGASVSLIGQHHQADESATAALGRILYNTATSHDPDQETKSELSDGVHWAYGILQGGLYGVMRPVTGDSDLLGGALFGTGLWLLGDETVVPLLGLQDGPSAAPPSTHLNRLALHLAYGLTTAATTQLTKRVTQKW